jgi:hypothetical protein
MLPKPRYSQSNAQLFPCSIANILNDTKESQTIQAISHAATAFAHYADPCTAPLKRILEPRNPSVTLMVLWTPHFSTVTPSDTRIFSYSSRFPTSVILFALRRRSLQTLALGRSPS